MYSQFKLINANLQEVDPSFLSFFQLQSRVIYVENSGCREFNCKLLSESELLKLCCLCQDSLLIVMWPWWQVWTLNWEEIMRLCLHIFKLDCWVDQGWARVWSWIFEGFILPKCSLQTFHHSSHWKIQFKYTICDTKYTISDIPNTQSQLQNKPSQIPNTTSQIPKTRYQIPKYTKYTIWFIWWDDERLTFVLEASINLWKGSKKRPFN